MKERVMVMHIENFTKPLFQVVLETFQIQAIQEIYLTVSLFDIQKDKAVENF